MAWKKVPCPTCPANGRPNGTRNYDAKQCALCVQKAREVAKELNERQRPAALVAADRERARTAEQLSLLSRKYQAAQSEIQRLEKDLRALNVLRDTAVEPFEIVPRFGSGTSEGAVFWVASDWHSEERVRPAEVSGLNEFNLEIAKERATRFFQGGLRLTRLLEQDIKIDTINIPLLGDFISNDIHEENVETSLLEPMHALTFARQLLVSGINFTLDNTKQNLHFICHSGNHARTTQKTRNATENGHSLEYLMYLHLADIFKGEKRVSFNIAEGYHSYLPVYGEMFRFHHGHKVNYQGGVGGITIPVNKAIAQWDKARPAAMDVFGHFHQAIAQKKFICNGSLIGYNAYALSIKAEYEPPQQQLFLMDKKRGRTCVWPIIVGANRTR